MERPDCEICGKPATVAMTDIEECYDHKTGRIHSRPFGEPHYFCDDHDRESRIYQGPPINWPYDVPNAVDRRVMHGQPRITDMEHFNGLTPAEAERLALLAEECGEVIQAIGKVLRHGYESAHPDGGPINREGLERECGDVRHAMIRLCNEGDLSRRAIHERANEKAASVLRYLHHQGHNACGEPGGTDQSGANGA